MNRVDRLFAILLYLQRRRRVRAIDLARVFEVSERTIYRDMLALSESGVPIVALPGAGYELSEGYFLPPLLFTANEAQALSLSARLFMTLTTGSLSADAEQALAKMSLVLPSHMRHAVDRLSSTIAFITPSIRVDLDDPRLGTIQVAIQEQRVVRLRYYSYNQHEHTEREIEPHLLSYFNGAWYVSAYCRLRQAPRDFRLDRIELLTLLPQTFDPRTLAQATADVIEVRVRFAPHIVRWVRERQHYAFQTEETMADDGSVVMCYHVTALSELRPWLLSWGAAAEPLSPEALREEIRHEMEKLLKLLT